MPDGIRARTLSLVVNRAHSGRWHVTLELTWWSDDPAVVTFEVRSDPPHPALPEGRADVPTGLLALAVDRPVSTAAVHAGPTGANRVHLELLFATRPWAVTIPRGVLRDFVAGTGVRPGIGRSA